MQYEDYKVEDFLFDEFFVRWVKNPGPETEYFWENWVVKNPGKLQIVNKAREIINSVEPRRKFAPSQDDYNEVLENILKQPNSWTQLGYAKKNDRLTAWVKYAAAIIILICFGGVITYLNIYESQSEALAIQYNVKESPYGQKTTFDLRDGTIVKLNAGSKLTFAETFSGDERRVFLEGEAFFNVKRDESQPFVVETKDLATTVLGTSFNIKSYKDDDESLVAVVSGKVKVIKTQEGNKALQEFLLLEKNQMITYNSFQNSLTKIESVPGNILAWKDNVIHFNNADFNTIIKTLTKWYGVEIEVEQNRSFRGRIKNLKYENEKLELVLEGLKGEYGFNYRFTDSKKVYIY